MSHDDVRQVGNHLELFQDGKQTTLAGDPIVFTEADAETLRNEFYDQTDFAEKYAWTPENLAVLTRVSAKLNRFNPLPTAITKSRIIAAYMVANAAGGACGDCGTLEKLREEAPAALPRTNDGRFATEHELLRQEVRRMLDDPSTPASALRARASKDAAFRMAMEAEMTPVAPTRPALSREEQIQEDATGELDSFVRSWKKCPNPRFIGGYLQLDEHTRLTPAELDQWLNRAAQAGKL